MLYVTGMSAFVLLTMSAPIRADTVEIWGDEIERIVAWKGGYDVSRLAGRRLRLRFAMTDADLYAIRSKP